MEELFKKHRILISQVSTKIIRDLMHTINWDSQLVAIRGCWEDYTDAAIYQADIRQQRR